MPVGNPYVESVLGTMSVSYKPGYLTLLRADLICNMQCLRVACVFCIFSSTITDTKRSNPPPPPKILHGENLLIGCPHLPAGGLVLSLL